jgi:molecular chaperone HscC
MKLDGAMKAAPSAMYGKETRFGCHTSPFRKKIIQTETLPLYLGELTVRVPRNMQALEEVRVRFTYDVSGLLEVDVTVVSTGRKGNLVITELAGAMSDADINAALKKLAAIKVHPRDDAANLHLRARLDAAFAMARGDARNWVTDMLLTFDAAIDAQDKSALATLRHDLHAQLDTFEAQHVT